MSQLIGDEGRTGSEVWLSSHGHTDYLTPSSPLAPVSHRQRRRSCLRWCELTGVRAPKLKFPVKRTSVRWRRNQIKNLWTIIWPLTASLLPWFTVRLPANHISADKSPDQVKTPDAVNAETFSMCSQLTAALDRSETNWPLVEASSLWVTPTFNCS